MKKIKVLLADPRHHTIGIHSTYVPVGVGYIATYLMKMIPSCNFEVKISVNSDEILDLIDNWKPNVLGFSSYIWNSNLSYRLAEYAKEKNKEVLCVLGGPEFPSGTGISNFTEIVKKNCFNYLYEKPCIDYYCYSDGETSFTSVVNKYLETNCSAVEMKKNNVAANGSMNLSSDNKKLLVGAPILRLGLSNKADGRDCIPSPYLTGLLDKFLNGKFIPSFESARGCPFFCTFCDQGLDETKIVSFTTKRMSEELDYVCEKVTKYSGTRSIAFFDSNWGMYKKDVDLSDHLLKLINEKNWPSYIEISTPKNKKQQIFDIDKKLKYRVQVGLQQQSMNRDTLKLIKRDNIFTNEQYLEFIKELERRNKVPGCELIIPLPNETKQTYFDSTKNLLDAGVSIGTYTLMMLQGAELGRDEAIKKYGMEGRWRIVPREFGIYKGKKVFDVEQVCVGTNTMPYKDYLECRRFSFLIHLFTYSVFFPLKKLIKKELNISFFDFVWLIFQNLEKNNNQKYLNSNFSKLYFEFSKECEEELFASKKDIYDYYSKDENYKKLLTSELGDNLLRKYSAKMICNALSEVVDFSIDLIPKILSKETMKKVEIKAILESFRLWLTNLYIFDAIFNWEKEKNNETVINLEYDVPSWYINDQKSILNFKKKINYKMVYNKRNEYLKNEIITLHGKKDKIYAVGKYFHQMSTNAEDIKKTSAQVS